MAPAEDNLAYLIDHKEECLAIVSVLLTQCGLDTAAGVPANELVMHEVAAVDGPAFAPIGSSREGPKSIFCMLMDVGILLDEMVLARRSDYHRPLDLGRQNAAETASWQRLVLLRSVDRVVPAISSI